MVARAVMVAAALAGAAWLGLSLHWTHLQDEARAVVASAPAGAAGDPRFERARALVERAQAHNPDARPDLLEGGILLRAGREREAVAIFRRVLDREPRNLTALAGLYHALKDVDPPAAEAAARRIRELAPRGPEG